MKKISANWLKPLGREDALSVLRTLALTHAAEAGPLRGMLSAILNLEDYGALLDVKLDYTDIRHTVSSVYHSRQALAFFQKLDTLDIGVDKEAVAYAQFKRSEERCGTVNRTLRSLLNGTSLSPQAYAIIHGAMRKISSVLGDVPTLDELKPRFGPGATTSCNSKIASPRWKLGARLECSNELLSSAHAALRSVRTWGAHHSVPSSDGWSYVEVHVCPGRLQFVPKSAKTHRSIVVEPVLNGFFQLGIGSYLKRRLLRAGVNLYDQSRNQALAATAHVTGLATIDLSAASDSIALATVKELLPIDWFDFLSRFRTGRVAYKDETITLEKFSSMGNGFTFELETLIFWALTTTTADVLGYHTNKVSVYGDDIICPSGCVETLIEVFSIFGFVVNEEKSFLHPPFYESCGADWYFGFDVRPYYQKQAVTAETLFSLHNFYVRSFDTRRAKLVRKYIHPDLQIFGPDGYGDGHLLGSWAVKYAYRDRGWGGYFFDTFSRKRSRNTGIAPGDSVLPHYSIYVGPTEEPTDHLVVRGSYGYKKSSIYTLTPP